MKWLRFFFKQDKYIMRLEKSIKLHEDRQKLDEEWIRNRNSKISVQDISIADLKREVLSLKEEIALLKSEPPEPKLATNIDISDPIFQKMIKAGRNILVKKAHPDHGGSRAEFEKVEKAYEMLKTLRFNQRKRVTMACGWS